MMCDSIVSWVILTLLVFAGLGFLFFSAIRHEGFRCEEADKVTSVYRGF